MRRLAFSIFTAIVLAGVLPGLHAIADPLLCSWPADCERRWVGPDLWANRLQDWCITGGVLECLAGDTALPYRTVHVVTRRVDMPAGTLELALEIEAVGGFDESGPEALAGFLVGAGHSLDYRAAALAHHTPGEDGGLIVGIEGAGRLVVRDNTQHDWPVIAASEPDAAPHDGPVTLALRADVRGGNCEITLVATGPGGRSMLPFSVDPARLRGNIALISHPGAGDGGTRFRFPSLTIGGSMAAEHEDRHCGPVLSTQYTLHEDTLTMTAQCMPVGGTDSRAATLQARSGDGWEVVDTAEIDPLSHTAHFRVEGWNDTVDTPVRVVYDYRTGDGGVKTYYRSATVRRDPVNVATITVAAFTGNHNVQHWGIDYEDLWVNRQTFPWNAEGVWFPHADIVRNVRAHGPDLLFFSGDQVYESASPTRMDIDHVHDDYLYKWYLWCWAFRDLTRDIPAVILPDDHDVYHGNLWGSGGRHAEQQDDGGYLRGAEFVKMVERTQTKNLPAPYDPTPIEQGIEVCYTGLNWGGVSFAVIEDRKFKSSATPIVPEAQVVNGFFRNRDFDPRDADVSGAVLLGDRQLAFLTEWAADWADGVWMKAVLSGTLFAKLETLPLAVMTDDQKVRDIVQLGPGEYPPDDIPVPDTDSNGWPQTGRNEALRAMRRGFAVHINGDQHLGSTVQYGVDDWGDAGYAICVPSVANFWPRRWYPMDSGANRAPGSPRYSGDYFDPFGNLVTVFTVSNPVKTGRKPLHLNDKAPGYGIVRFDRAERTITFECWPRWADPSRPGSIPYSGWPVVAEQQDNYGREPAAWLPTIQVRGMTEPVVQIIEEQTGEIVYTLRIAGGTFRPYVLAEGMYTVRIGEPGTENWREYAGVMSDTAESREQLTVEFITGF